MYSTEDVECLCPQCIANGEAAKKFHGEFVQAAEDFKVNDENKREELYCRTPGYMSWQGEYWLACCDDYSAYIGEVGTKELEQMDREGLKGNDRSYFDRFQVLRI